MLNKNVLMLILHWACFCDVWKQKPAIHPAARAMTENIPAGIRLEKEVIIVNELGLHARSAAKIAKIAQKARGPIRISMQGRQVDAKSMLDIMTLAAGKGAVLLISAKDFCDEALLCSIAALVEQGFGEE
jgi:phosphocarrier protein